MGDKPTDFYKTLVRDIEDLERGSSVVDCEEGTIKDIWRVWLIGLSDSTLGDVMFFGIALPQST